MRQYAPPGPASYNQRLETCGERLAAPDVETWIIDDSTDRCLFQFGYLAVVGPLRARWPRQDSNLHCLCGHLLLGAAGRSERSRTSPGAPLPPRPKTLQCETPGSNRPYSSLSRRRLHPAAPSRVTSCSRRESNPHGRYRSVLKGVRMPISPREPGGAVGSRTRGLSLRGRAVTRHTTP